MKEFQKRTKYFSKKAMEVFKKALALFKERPYHFLEVPDFTLVCITPMRRMCKKRVSDTEQDNSRKIKRGCA